MSAFWWVNQGQSYEQERRAGLMWAPIVDAAGHTLGHWESMTLVRPGDLVLHYAAGAVQAIGPALSAARRATKPDDLPESWGPDGRLVDVAYQPAATPVRLEEIPLDLRLAENAGPFTSAGRVKQAYLFALSPAFGEQFLARFGDRFEGPDAEVDPADEGGGVLPQDPALRKAIERYAVEEVLKSLRQRYGAVRVKEMPQNHPGHDIQVDRSPDPILHVEVKGTARRLPAFLMSETERLFSVDHAAAFELHVVWGISLGGRTHAGVEIRSGEVARDTHGLVVQRWQGRLPMR